MKYEFLEHTADIKFKAYGKTQNEVFENAVLAIAEYISRGEGIKTRKGKVINVEGEDLENLLYNFIEKIIVLIETEKFVTAKAKVTIRGNNLRAELFGDDVDNYEGLDTIKAVTYSEMFVKKNSGGWEMQVVLDV